MMMAKAKKTAAPARIPAEEIPYIVPANWRWVRLGSINQYEGDNVEPSAQSDTIFELYSVPCYEQKYPEIVAGEKIGSAKKSVKKNDVLLCKINPRINRVWKVEQYTEHPLIASGEWAIIRNPDIFADYLMRYFQAPVFRKYLLSNVSGVGGSLMRARPKFIDIYPVPLPPRVEQERIVACIEELFEKLDAAEEKLRAVIEGSPARRAALLRRAFTGDLTASWRAAHGRTMDMWEKRSFGNCIDKMQNGLSKRRGVEGELYGVLRLANLGTDDICTEDLREILLTKKEQEKYSLHANDVVMIRVNGSKGNVARQLLIKSEQKWAFCDHIIRIRYKTDVVNPEYMILFSQSHEYKQYIAENMVSSAGQNTISRKGMENLIVPVPSLEEQKQMVHIFNAFISDEDEARAVAEAALAKIPALRQAVLARAFRGQLGTNDPAEPPALSE